jgi:hypothetical protein
MIARRPKRRAICFCLGVPSLGVIEITTCDYSRHWVLFESAAVLEGAHAISTAQIFTEPGRTAMRRFSTRIANVLATALACVVLGAGAARAQVNFKFEYAAKFVCGLAVPSPGTVPGTLPVAPGYYYTAINVHNPSTTELNQIQKRFVIALPGEAVGRKSGFTHEDLRADDAMEIDCPDIARRLDLGVGRFVKGFVVIRSTAELDIVAVYTAATSPTGAIVSMTLERVPKRP